MLSAFSVAVVSWWLAEERETAEEAEGDSRRTQKSSGTQQEKLEEQRETAGDARKAEGDSRRSRESSSVSNSKHTRAGNKSAAGASLRSGRPPCLLP